MKFKSILAAIAILACGTVSAQNATKADLSKLESQLNALTQKVSQLETNLERVITENVNLVEQLNIKTVTSMVDEKNGITFDIVKVEPDAKTNDVVVSLRITNNSGTVKKITFENTEWVAYDSNSNKSDNSYKAWEMIQIVLENGIPVNSIITFKKVPPTCSYLSIVKGLYKLDSAGLFDKFALKFTGVHIPW